VLNYNNFFFAGGISATFFNDSQNKRLILKAVLLLDRWFFVQVSMKLEMKDSPGQLVAALRPISEVGGNIIAVIHQRDPDLDDDTLNVQIVLDLPEGRREKLVELLKEQGVHIQRIGEERLLYQRTVIMIGHLMHTDLSDTVDQIDSTGFAEVCELSMSMPAVNERSSSRITIKAASKGDMEAALAILRRVSHQKSLLLIEPLEEIA
jgi:ACT domain-containing protein